MPQGGAVTARAASRWRDAAHGTAGVCLLYVAACALYVLLGRGIPIPTLAPDEFTYAGLARSIADGHGKTLLGQPEELRAALYVYLIAPAWLGSSTVNAYALTKVAGALFACLTVFPVWLLARRYVSSGWAIVAAGLAVCGTWMTVTSAVILENAAYPLATAALASAAVLLERPGGRWGWAALGFALLAGASRYQLAVLIPVIAIAILVDVARCGTAWRARLREYGWFAAVPAAVSVLGVAVVLTSRDTALGGYAGITITPPLHSVIDAIAWQSTGVVTMIGILPACAVLAISSRRSAWRDGPLRPLLIVTWCAIVIFIAQSAWAIAGFTGLNWHIQRYAMYVLPLAFVVLVAGSVRGHLTLRRLVVATVAVAAVTLLAPSVRNAYEELGQFAASRIVHAVLGLDGGSSIAIACVVLTALAVGTAALVARDRGREASVATAVVIVSLLTFAAQDTRAWSWRIDAARAQRTAYPHDLQWLDHQSPEPASVLVGTSNTPYNNVAKLFNRTITSQLLPLNPVGGYLFYGRVCRWRPDPTGRLQITGGCNPGPHRFYLEDPVTKFTFYDQEIEADRPGFARVVTTPRLTTARLRSVLKVLCGPAIVTVDYTGAGRTHPARRTCLERAVAGSLWLDEPGVLELTFRGGAARQRILIGGVRFIAPRRTTTLRIPVPAATAQSPVVFSWPIDWGGAPPRSPDLIRARLVQRSGATDLLY